MWRKNIDGNQYVSSTIFSKFAQGFWLWFVVWWFSYGLNSYMSRFNEARLDGIDIQLDGSIFRPN